MSEQCANPQGALAMGKLLFSWKMLLGQMKWWLEAVGGYFKDLPES